MTPPGSDRRDPRPSLVAEPLVGGATETVTSPDPMERFAGARGWALFLDIDGTLLDLAPHPERVVVPADLPGRLRRLSRALDGALALVSGRPLAGIDRLFPRESAPMAPGGGGMTGGGFSRLLGVAIRGVTGGVIGEVIAGCSGAVPPPARWPGWSGCPGSGWRPSPGGSRSTIARPRNGRRPPVIWRGPCWWPWVPLIGFRPARRRWRSCPPRPVKAPASGA